MIIMHELPLSFVDYDGFRDVLDFLAPDFNGMSRNTLKSEVMKLYEVEKSRTMMMLDENTSSSSSSMWDVKGFESYKRKHGRQRLVPEDEILRGEVMDEDNDE
ncbi:hypothetical protein Q3G72_024680 [Acer saccharum]|nr:hypothetical protein Q3G72_024680 [Acer saccharum]